MSSKRFPDLRLEHSQGETLVLLGPAALERAQGRARAWAEGRTVFVINSPVVARLAGESVESLLGGVARLETLQVEEGEAAKTIATAGRLWEEMIAAGGRRDSRVIGLGGGSVGDLAGFVAGAFLRGVEFALVPTTLLAQVDASIGGKTAVDMPMSKNSVGLFWFPRLVISDVGLLSSLPRLELQSGLIEVIKIGAASDLGLFEMVEKEIDCLLEGDRESLATVIHRAVEAKIRVVADDPREDGERRLLNLGHTLAHAMETELGYEGLRHGEAVAYGLLFACRLAKLRGADRPWIDRLEILLGRLTLPALPPMSREALMRIMARDKKSTRTGITWVLPLAPGRVEIVHGVPAEAVAEELGHFLA